MSLNPQGGDLLTDLPTDGTGTRDTGRGGGGGDAAGGGGDDLLARLVRYPRLHLVLVKPTSSKYQADF